MKRVLFLIIMLMVSAAAQAELITVEFSGSVTDVNDGYNLLAGLDVSLGDTFTGRYTYDTSQPPLTHIPDQSSYVYTTHPNGIVVYINDLIIQTDPANVDFLIQIANDKDGKDFYIVNSSNNLPLNTLEITDINWQLQDTTMAALTDHYITSDAPEVSLWPYNSLTVMGGSDPMHSGMYFWISGMFSQAQVVSTAIPEPGSFILLGVGLAGLLKRR